MKTLKSILFATLLLVSGAAFACTASLTWTNATQDTKGNPTTITKDTVYRGTKADGSDLVAIFTSTSAVTSYVDTTCIVGTNYYAVTDWDVTGESAKSSLVAKVETVDVPKPPTGLTLVPNNPTAFRLVENLNRLAMVETGKIKSNATCDASTFVNTGGKTYYRIDREQVTMTTNWNPADVYATCN